MSFVEGAQRGTAENFKMSLCLGALAAVATAPLWPYLVMAIPRLGGRFTALHWTAACLQTGVLCWLLGWCGLWMGRRYGLDAPWLRALIHPGAPRPSARPRWMAAAVIGATTAAIVVALLPLGPKAMPDIAGFSPLQQAWRGALASLYGGIVEEILLRLFTVSLLVWLIARCNSGHAPAWSFKLAICCAAVLFGAGHLPGAAAMGLVGGWQAASWIVLLNSLVGIASGYMFWKHGLEHAMLCHVSADFVLHVVQPFMA